LLNRSASTRQRFKDSFRRLLGIVLINCERLSPLFFYGRMALYCSKFRYQLIFLFVRVSWFLMKILFWGPVTLQ
jgi:hypothetical protein